MLNKLWPVMAVLVLLLAAPAMADDPVPDPDARLKVSWFRELSYEWVCKPTGCYWKENVYFTGISIWAPPAAPEQTLRFTQLDENGQVVDEIEVGSYIGSIGCVPSNVSFTQESFYYDMCVNDHTCQQMWTCPGEVGIEYLDGYCAVGPQEEPGWYDCGCLSNQTPCEEAWWEWIFGGSSGWTPGASTDFAAFESCDESAPFTTVGACGEEEETCFPVCGGAF